MFKLTFCDSGVQSEVNRFLAEWHDDKDYIVAHTSGSTGAPKEIRLPKADMRLSARATNLRLNITENSRLFCPLSGGYIAGKMMIVRALEADCELGLCTPSNSFMDSSAVEKFMQEGAVDLVAVVPSQAKILLVVQGVVRNVIIGGAPISPELEMELVAHGNSATHFYATYGMTETCSHVALRQLGSEEYRAMEGVKFDVDRRGCLKIIAPRYSFKELQTNDVVALLPGSDTAFRWLSRYDNVINSGGVKLYPEKIEAKLAPYVPYPFYIKGVPHEKWGTGVCLVFEHPDSDSSREHISALKAICREHLDGYEVPVQYCQRQQFRHTASGKLLRD